MGIVVLIPHTMLKHKVDELRAALAKLGDSRLTYLGFPIRCLLQGHQSGSQELSVSL